LSNYALVTVKKLIKIPGSAGTIPGGYPERNHDQDSLFAESNEQVLMIAGIRGFFKDPALKPS
jgi:hypothetical protein